MRRDSSPLKWDQVNTSLSPHQKPCSRTTTSPSVTIAHSRVNRRVSVLMAQMGQTQLPRKVSLDTRERRVTLILFC